MSAPDLEELSAQLSALRSARPVGRVTSVGAGGLVVSGLDRVARVGDHLVVRLASGARLDGEVAGLDAAGLKMLPNAPVQGVSLGDPVTHYGPRRLAPSSSWIGRIVDPYGMPLDGRRLMPGPAPRNLLADPPAAASRRGLGERLETGMAALNTLLPVVRGQRVGLFAGSGVGKSSMLAKLAQRMEADVVVIALVGERGRELREFVDETLGPEGMARSVVVAATSDRSALTRRQCAYAAMTVAEHFRDEGKHVLLLADSITRFAEAHREIAVASGEPASLRGFPPSAANTIMALCERAGPGPEGAGDITALFSVLVAGSDMEEPVADMMRGVLDGHIVLDRQIAERGRYPAINLVRSVSRSLPKAATAPENALISDARSLLGLYEQSAVMIRAGLYSSGSDPALDRAISLWSGLDGFLAEDEPAGIDASFGRLGARLKSPPRPPR